LVNYRTEYYSLITGVTANWDGSRSDKNAANEEGLVMEYVDVRNTQLPISRNGDAASQGGNKGLHVNSHSKGHSYITIFSPAVNEALRCVVDYYPSVDLSGNTIKVKEPFAIFVFYERELTEYRNRLLTETPDDSCANKYAHKHIGIVQDFVRSRVQKIVDAERERHARGFATFDMLWLLYKPGCDVYYDVSEVIEHEPYVLKDVDFYLANGVTNEYKLSCWNMDAAGTWVGPSPDSFEIRRFAGEIEIVKLRAYPCEFLKFAKGVTEEDALKIREHFISRGKKWYQLTKGRQCHDFEGFTTSFPRRKYTSLVMVDRIGYNWWSHKKLTNPTIEDSVAHTCSPLVICSCDRCGRLIYQRAVKPKFSGYSKFDADTVNELTEHHYFICENAVQAFVFRTRSWEYLHINGFRPPVFNKTLFDNLVLKESTKEMIKNLTEMYIRDSTIQSSQEESQYAIDITKILQPAKPVQKQATWSADYVQGKGDCLIFLFHGKPGVGKTYTAECIAEHTSRPLLTLTCADIGVKPDEIESSLLQWFKVAQDWGALVLIDEADIYMEERQTQDLERNHVVAGFLRALEYFRGILFLTTNRVGTFDEAFISRIHVPVYYAEFDDEQRARIWDRFFEKLEEDREATMRILQSTKDYTQSQELQDLEWNGREIRNGESFQVAVALAEAQGHKDKAGRVLIKPEHIKASVSMSGEFKNYLEHVHRAPQKKKAAMMGLRYDAYGVSPGGKGGRSQGEREDGDTY
ncbi:P-loop containing nucleoside triphosphate hydrolase protein, partial [Corynascus novoguineensis]